MMRVLFPLALLATLAACAGSPDWVNPAVPKERWSTDFAACRRAADAEIGPADRIEPDDRSSLPGRMLDREDTRKMFNGYVASCMQDKGYRRAR